MKPSKLSTALLLKVIVKALLARLKILGLNPPQILKVKMYRIAIFGYIQTIESLNKAPTVITVIKRLSCADLKSC